MSAHCEPVGYSSPGSFVLGIIQARILEWVAIPPPGDLPDPGMELGSLTLQTNSLPSEPPKKPKFQKIRLIYTDEPVPYSFSYILTSTCYFLHLSHFFLHFPDF